MIKTDFVIVTPFYLRKDIFLIYLNFLKLLKKEINVEVILIGSGSIEGEGSIVKNAGFKYIFTKKNSLSNKWNVGIQQLKNYDYKYLLMLGSDDIISTNLICRLSKKIDEGYDMAGVADIFFFDIITRDLYYWGGYDGKRKGESIGAGRIYSSKLIRKLEYQLWTNGLKRGLDLDIYNKLKNKKKYCSKIQDDEYLIDIKNNDDIQISKVPGRYKNLKKTKNQKLLDVVKKITIHNENKNSC
jgi:hypothetical protein